MTKIELDQEKKERKEAIDYFTYSFRSAGVPDKGVRISMVNEYARKTGSSLSWTNRQLNTALNGETK